MSTILDSHYGYVSELHSDDDENYDADHVDDYHYHDENEEHLNDPSLCDEEVPLPQTVPLPVPMRFVPMPQSQLATLETRSESRSSFPDWEVPSTDSLSVSSSRSPRDLEKELDELRALVRSLSQQPEKQHEKLVPMPPLVQPPSTGMPFATKGLTAPAIDNTPRGSFSNHDQHQAEHPGC